MTFEEINLMPSLEMGRPTYQRTRGVSKHFNEPGLQKLSSWWNEN
jgi:hypothetical protein